MTLEELEDYFYYDPTDKTFCLKAKLARANNAVKVGSKVGCKTKQGYIHVSFKETVYKLHRLVYMLKERIPDTSLLPSSVDHIDRDVTNNLMENLRDGSTKDLFCTNSRNRSALGASKYIGVSYSDKLRGKFQAAIQVNLQEVALLRYGVEMDCAEVYKSACKYLNFEIDPIYNDVIDIPLLDKYKKKIDTAINSERDRHLESKYKGVVWNRQRGKYVATIHIYDNLSNSGRNVRVGTYEDDKTATIMRDLLILEKGYQNPTNIVTEDTYDYYRCLYPKETIKKLKVTDKITGEVSIYNSRIHFENEKHICRKRLRKIVEFDGENTTPWEFEYIYVDKEYS